MKLEPFICVDEISFLATREEIVKLRGNPAIAHRNGLPRTSEIIATMAQLRQTPRRGPPDALQQSTRAMEQAIRTTVKPQLILDPDATGVFVSRRRI